MGTKEKAITVAVISAVILAGLLAIGGAAVKIGEGDLLNNTKTGIPTPQGITIQTPDLMATHIAENANAIEVLPYTK